MFRGYAAKTRGGQLERFDYDPGPLADDDVEIAVQYCGVCHSDLSMVNNEWGMTSYPVIPGHEVVGKIVAVGSGVTTLQVGQRVGLGWFSSSCRDCQPCLSGDQNLCATAGMTIVNRHGGFADRVRCQAMWAFPLPDGLDPSKVGPLFCGGLTVFNPIIQCDVRPTDRVGVIGIGGLGHMALQFLRAWGCEVVAFTSSDSKREEALKLGAHRTLNSRDEVQLASAQGTFNFILNTVNVTLNWDLYINCLSTRGRFHSVGAIAEPVRLSALPIIFGQRSFSGTPLGSPSTATKMLDFCVRHDIAPVVEHFPLSEVNQAMKHLESGQARYRIVLENDLDKS
ncbi:alcohol dehydrogenase catalytic domain-containing protein [bacterium]|nr:alcohol dehydrogenase catalytic domain-containing protein [bacterium]